MCSNLAESYAKRRYTKHFIAKVSDAAGENYETQYWLDVALDEQLIDKQTHQKFCEDSNRIGRLLSWMQANPDHFNPTKNR